MQFEYEITADEYVACQVLLYKMRSSGRKRIGYALAWFIPGAVFVFAGWDKDFFDWNLAQTVVVSLGLVWILFGILTFFPAWKPRLTYRRSGLVGKRFQADVNEDGFEVTGESRSWRVQWPAVAFKAENDKVFMLYAEPIVFSFGKKYLSDEQQKELRRFAGLAPR